MEKIDSKIKLGVITRIGELLVARYVFPDSAEKMRQSLVEKLSQGGYDAIDTPDRFAFELEKDLQAICHDHHLCIMHNPARARELIDMRGTSLEKIAAARRKALNRQKDLNCGFNKVERLPGNVGYLDLRFFADLKVGRKMADSAFSLLSNCQAVIIDLRRCYGGHPRTVQYYCSYFLSQPTHLNSIIRRYKKKPEEQYWSLAHVGGLPLYDQDVYILTSRFTRSASEEFAYTLQVLGRATLVGEVTRGDAHDESEEVILDEFVLSLPDGRAVNPITRTNWEGKGVQPDVCTRAPGALDAAHALALETLLETEKDAHRSIVFEFAWLAIRARLSPIQVNERVLQSYAGSYGKRKVTLKAGSLYYYESDDDATYRLVPISAQRFAAEGADDFQLEFNVADDGMVKECYILWDDGFRSILIRTE
ncbi:MAG: S41 family peptidase [Anaerolineaceae bacterium]|nr:S41 family peptidase [Anaerolineaceae bacterium]